MIELEDLIPGEIRIRDSNQELNREKTLEFFKNKTIVKLHSSVNTGIKDCAIIDNDLLDKYYKTHQTGTFNGIEVDLQLVEVLDYLNNVLRIKTTSSCAGHTLSVDPMVWCGRDRYGHNVDIYEYVPKCASVLRSENEAHGYISFKHIPPKPIRETLRERLGIPCSKFHEQIYNDRYEISWNVEKEQSMIDATCKELTDVILNNL